MVTALWKQTILEFLPISCAQHKCLSQQFYLLQFVDILGSNRRVDGNFRTKKLAQNSKVILVLDLVLVVITKGHCQVTTLKVKNVLAFFQEILNNDTYHNSQTRDLLIPTYFTDESCFKGHYLPG